MWRARRVARETSEGPRRSRSRRGREGASRTLDPFLPGKGLRITRQPEESLAPPRLFLRNFHGDLSSCSVEGVEFPPKRTGQRRRAGAGDVPGRVWENPPPGGHFPEDFYQVRITAYFGLCPKCAGGELPRAALVPLTAVKSCFFLLSLNTCYAASIESLLCARHRSRCWGRSNEQNRPKSLPSCRDRLSPDDRNKNKLYGDIACD